VAFKQAKQTRRKTWKKKNWKSDNIYTNLYFGMVENGSCGKRHSGTGLHDTDGGGII